MIAIGETVILLHSPLPLVGVSIEMVRECQQNDSLAEVLLLMSHTSWTPPIPTPAEVAADEIDALAATAAIDGLIIVSGRLQREAIERLA